MKKQLLTGHARYFVGIVLMAVLLLAGCRQGKVPAAYTDLKKAPTIYPDYRDVTVPVNMAPLRFELMDEAEEVVARLTADGRELVLEGRKVMPDADEWRELAKAGETVTVELFARQQEQWHRYQPFHIYVSPDSIDPWLSYRLISPSYVTFEDLTINQRSLEDYEEREIYNNMLCSTEASGQCINCHSYQAGQPDRMQFHARQNLGGTLILLDGQLRKVDLKCDSTISAGVYPAWHPTQHLIAYSTNATMQMFHLSDLNKIEVLDSRSDLILYDIDRNEVCNVEAAPDEFEVFPSWSPDGRYLYYCSAHFELNDTIGAEAEAIMRYKEIKYNIYRKRFDEQTRSFGPRELVFDAAASGLSATLPRISPDGRFLLLSVGEWGCFHIWHKDADLWLVDLGSGEARPLKEVNSTDVEAYHTWSSSGRWIVFSSRRTDGTYTRPFFAHVDRDGHATKPFELPSADPDYHRQLLKSYNVPELMKGPVSVSPHAFADALRQEAVRAHFVSKE